MFIDLSHVVEHGMITYRGIPAPIIGDFLTREASASHYEGGTTFQIGKIEMVANTGTYIDSPFHRYVDGKDLSEIPLSSLVDLPGIVLHAPFGARSLGAELFTGHNLTGKATLIHTGWDKHWRTERYFEGHPFITRHAAELLSKVGAALIGIDSYNIDDTSDGSRPAHSILLKAGIPIVEHLCHLEDLPDEGFTFFAVPVMVRGLGSFPVRAFAVMDA